MSHHLYAIDRKRKRYAVVATRYAGHVEATDDPNGVSELWRLAFDKKTGTRNTIEIVHENELPGGFKVQK